MDKDLLHWLDIKWFLPETIQRFDWEFPWMLYLIPAIPILLFLRWLFFFQFRQKLQIALPEGEVRRHNITLLRHLPKIFFMLFIGFLIIALARPQMTNEKIEQYSEGIDIMLLMDISESMLIEDFLPNRIEAAKDVAKDFVNGRINDRIGLVVFSGDAYSLCPLTTDYELLKSYVEEITFQMIQKSGTAIGSAIAVGTNRMREANASSKVMIVLSDGENTAGSIDPLTAAKLANAFGIKIYTIAVGREGKVPFGTDIFGVPRMVDNVLDETTLREVAKIGGGEFFRANDNRTLSAIFKKIDSMEKTEIQETRFKDTKDFYDVYLLWGMLCFLIWVLFKSTFMVNILED